MGSSSLSTSTTQYTNAPVTQEDVSNPLNILNSNARVGSTEIFAQGGGSVYLSNDPAVTGQAFEFGSKMIQVVADLTKANNAAKIEAGKDATKEAVTGDATTAAFDWTKYKTELMAGAAIIVLWWLGRKK